MKKCNWDQCWNKNKSWCECKKRHVGEKDYIWNPATWSCENGKYLRSIMDDSAIMCDEESYNKQRKTILTYFNEKKAVCKVENFYILLAFLLIIIALLIAFSIYCYLKKYSSIQKHLLSFHVANNKLKQVLYW